MKIQSCIKKKMPNSKDKNNKALETHYRDLNVIIYTQFK